jgi:hypothetical protein
VVAAAVAAGAMAFALAPGPSSAHQPSGAHPVVSAPDTAGTSNSGVTGAAAAAEFPIAGAPGTEAESIAVAYWGVNPCGGTIDVSWGELDPSLNALSQWWNPTSLYDNPSENSNCSITFNEAQTWDWPMFCTIMVHEYGHLSGHQHVNDPTNVMNPVYVGPIAQCASAPNPIPQAPAATASGVKVKAASAKKRVAHHRRHRKHRKHRKHHKHRRHSHRRHAKSS